MPSVQKGDPSRMGRALAGERVDDTNPKDARRRMYWSEGNLPSNILPPEAGDLNPPLYHSACPVSLSPLCTMPSPLGEGQAQNVPTSDPKRRGGDQLRAGC